MTRNPFDAPPSVVKRRVDYLNRMLDSDLAARGSSLAEYAQQDPDVYKRQEKQAEEDVRLTEILKKIADEEDVTISDQEFQMHAMRSAYRFGADPRWFLKKIQNEGMEDHFRAEALEEKVLAEITAKATAGSSEETRETATQTESNEKEDDSGISADGSGADE